MNETIKIEEAVSAVLAELERQRYSDTTIKSYRCNYNVLLKYTKVCLLMDFMVLSLRKSVLPCVACRYYGIIQSMVANRNSQLTLAISVKGSCQPPINWESVLRVIEESALEIRFLEKSFQIY